MMTRSGLPEIVGREHETTVLDDRLDAALAGEGQIVVIAGEPGIGKTRIAQYATARASALGMCCFWGRASEQAGTPPYWLFRQIVRDAASEELLSELGAAADDLSAIAAEAVPDSAGIGAPRTDRFLVFEAITTLLINSARSGGTLIVLDDVHWADVASIQLLAHLARGIDRSRLAVVATYRDTEAGSRAELSHTLADLAREPTVSRLRLVGLTSDEVARQLALVVGRPIDGATIDVVNRRTHGNPFFVAELGLLLEKQPDAAGELPDAVRVAVGHRLAGMPARVQRLVSIAAVLGERADSAALVELTEEALSAVLDDVDTATRAGVLASPTRFTHDLVAEVARGQLPSRDRLELHARMAEHLGSRADSQSRVAEIAHHWLESLPAGDARQAVTWAERAAQRAIEQMAWEQAVALLERAVVVASGPGFAPSERARLLQAQARAQLRAYDIAAAHEAVLAAAEIAKGTGDGLLLAAVALTLEEFSDATQHAQRALCEEALALLPDSEVVLRARLLAQLAVHMQMVQASPRARELSEQALAIAARTEDSAAMAVALHACQLSRSGPDGVHERLALGERMLTLGGSSRDDEQALWGRLWRFDALLQLGQVDAAETEIAPMTALVGQLRRPIARWHVLRSRAAIAFSRGRFDDATDLTNQCLALSQRAQHGGGILGGELMIILIGAQTGAELPPVLAKPDGWQVNSRDAGPLATWHVSAGNLTTARRLFSGYPAVEQVPAFILLPMLAGKAELAAALDDRAGANDVYPRLLPYADLFVCAGAGALYIAGSVQTWLGAAAGTLGRLDDAVRHLRAGIAANERAGVAPFTARAQLELARVLARRRRPGDVDEAAALAAVSGAEAQRMGMAPLLRWSRDIAATFDGAGPLTKREREIAELVSQGLTNRQIAAALHISERTAEAHVQHCLRKLGIHSRAQLAAWVSANTYRT